MRGNRGNIDGNGARTRADEDHDGLGSESPDEEDEFRGSRTLVLELRPFYALNYC